MLGRGGGGGVGGGGVKHTFANTKKVPNEKVYKGKHGWI